MKLVETFLHLILAVAKFRVNWPCKSSPTLFSRTCSKPVLRLGSACQYLIRYLALMLVCSASSGAPVFSDRVVSPSFVDDVVGATAHLLRSGSPNGLYHCVNTGFGTWLDLGREIARLLDQTETTLKPVSVRDVKLRASRPQFAALSNAKLARAGYAMPTWQDSLQRYLTRRSA